MKVLCISNFINPDANKHGFTFNITVGKWYMSSPDGYLESSHYYYVINESGHTISYPTRLFKTICEVREEKLNTLIFQ
jgi:hypothetical protein